MAKQAGAERARRTGDDALPGDPDRDEVLAQIVRVDQAGEYGAKRIYEGQLAVLGNTDAGGDFNEVSLREGRFTTRVWTSDVNTQFSPFVSLVNRIQFDSVTRQLGWQARFRWITKPGNDIFLVYTRNWTDRTTLQTLDQKGTIKIVRTIRF